MLSGNKHMSRSSLGSTIYQCLQQIRKEEYLSFFATGFVCVEVLRPSQPNGVMSSVVSLPNHTFTGQA